MFLLLKSQLTSHQCSHILDNEHESTLEILAIVWHQYSRSGRVCGMLPGKHRKKACFRPWATLAISMILVVGHCMMILSSLMSSRLLLFHCPCHLVMFCTAEYTLLKRNSHQCCPLGPCPILCHLFTMMLDLIIGSPRPWLFIIYPTLLFPFEHRLVDFSELGEGGAGALILLM